MTYMPQPGDFTQKKITLIPGDGPGPEVVSSVERVVEAMGAPIIWERFDNLSGSIGGQHPREEVPEEILTSIQNNKVCLKGTLFTPIDKSTNTQSLNVQLRKLFDLQVNMVHAFSIPGLQTRHENLDIVVIRENTEGEYSGLEHEVVPDVVESLKVITQAKSMRTAEYAFEFASLNNRRKVTAVHKANIMKMSDGLFLSCCRELSQKYSNIEFEEMIVDNTCMQLATKPEQFDVMVTPNLYGNIVSNVAAGLCGGHGISPGCNVGNNVAIFEQGARHTAREETGLGVSNPTAMLLSTAMMMRHLKWHDFSSRLENAVMQVYKQGDRSLLTPDVGGTGNLNSFTEAVIRAVKG
eukprot:TRINITY_DN40784_c1_g1_i1.p1 TRINITY_DN40784_c1_g1~~TRINITY_DN40784_c1_g1_i1.p1  ORF type:complete len:412 (+),score=40.34 TRINITY_DN40784_c1_g1_i1:183-1238(+)